MIRQITSGARYGNISSFNIDSFIGKSIVKYGEYSQHEMDFLARWITKESVVIEVGANIGTLTIPISKICGRVFAYEPQPLNLDLLDCNLKSNSCMNVSSFNMAISDYEGEISVQALGDVSNNNFGSTEVGKGNIKVTCTTIDEEFKKCRDVGLIKIDVEGHEAQVLRGAKETILAHEPFLYVEADRQEKVAELISIIRSYGYVCYWHCPPLFNRNNFFGDDENVFGEIVSINLFCIPASSVPALEPEIFGCDFISHLDNMFVQKQIAAPAIVQRDAWATVVRLGGIGDNLVAASVLPLLKKQGFKVEVIAQRPRHVVFENNPNVDRLSPKEDRDMPQGDMLKWQEYWQARGRETDKFFNLSHSMEGLLALHPAMTAFYWPEKFRRRQCNRSYLEVAHDICEVPYEFGPMFFPTDAEKKQARETREKFNKGKPVLGWCVSGSRIDKLHPYSAMVIARIIRELDFCVMMFCDPHKDFEIAKQIHEHVKRQNGSDEGLLHAGGDQWPIRRSLAQVLDCDVVVSPDTGPAWAAAFEGMLKVILLSHASQENITKHWKNTISLHADQKRVPCWPCHRLHDSISTCTPNIDGIAAACMTDISVEMILAAIKKGTEKWRT